MDTLTHYPHSCIRKETEMTWDVLWIKYAMYTVCRNCISHQNYIQNSLKVQMRQSFIFPRYPALYFSSFLLAVLFSLLPQHISPLYPAKPIRDLRASLPLNYHPNQCRGLWYRIICQISADGWGQVPLCQRPYPRGNLCSGWALLIVSTY